MILAVPVKIAYPFVLASRDFAIKKLFKARFIEKEMKDTFRALGPLKPSF